LGGTAVPLPNDQQLNNITVNGINTVFTVTQAGIYYISYNINLTEGLLVGARITVNGTPVEQFTINPLLTLSNFHADGILTLAAGDSITLQLFGLLGVATLQEGLGASLTIIRLDD